MVPRSPRLREDEGCEGAAFLLVGGHGKCHDCGHSTGSIGALACRSRCAADDGTEIARWLDGNHLGWKLRQPRIVQLSGLWGGFTMTCMAYEETSCDVVLLGRVFRSQSRRYQGGMPESQRHGLADARPRSSSKSVAGCSATAWTNIKTAIHRDKVGGGTSSMRCRRRPKKIRLPHATGCGQTAARL